MPQYAVDSNTNEIVEIGAWLLTRHRRGKPLCRVHNCGVTLTIVGEHNPDRATHFRHPPSTNCPSILTNAVPYRQLQNVPIDHAQIATIKMVFLNNIHQIFNKCSSLIPNLSFQEFFEIIENAHNLNIWGYRDIDLEYIPYILCTCNPYFVQRTPYRNHPFHFVFSEIQRVDELWINAGNNAHVIYRVDRTTQDVENINIIFDLNNFNNHSNLPQNRINSINVLLN
ncbi:MAG: hypothetical protein PHQ22_09985 [Sulfuricurvum sp.]|nr:hypothetical protein [Sulfuricurvum sp.]MDD5387508.1 hypothetical protein [Sulfuricurvum sp.]